MHSLHVSNRANTPSLTEEKRPSRTSAKLPPLPTSRGSDSSDAEVDDDDDDDDADYDDDAYKGKCSNTHVPTKSASEKPERCLVTKMRASRSLMLAKATAAAAAAAAVVANNSKSGNSQSQKTRQRRNKIRPKTSVMTSPVAVKTAVCNSHRQKIASTFGRRNKGVKKNVFSPLSASAVSSSARSRASSSAVPSSVIPPYNASFLDLENISSDDEESERKTSKAPLNHQVQRANRDSSRHLSKASKKSHHSHCSSNNSRGAVNEAPTARLADDDEDTFEKRLDRHLATLRLSYIHFYKRMQTDPFRRSIRAQIEEEEEKKKTLSHSASKLEKQIQFLIKDSQELLLSRLRELGVEGNTPNDLLVIAHRIVEGHKTLQSRAQEDQVAVEALEAENAALLVALESARDCAEVDSASPTVDHHQRQSTSSGLPVKREEVICEKDPGDVPPALLKSPPPPKSPAHVLGMSGTILR